MDSAAVQQLLDSAIEEYAVPGAQLGLLSGKERTVACAGSVGVDSADPVVAQTAFRAGSLAKALTGLLVLDAANRGDLSLDVPCSGQGDGLWDETPRALLSQTSGRPNVLPEPEDELADFVASTAHLPLLHEPGRFSYCNAGWSVLDLLLRRTTGAGFEASAKFALGDLVRFEEPEGAAQGHACVPGGEPTPVPSVAAPAASAAGSRWWATADELLDFADLNLHGGGEVFNEADVRGVRTSAAALPGATVFDSWGLGWGVWDRGDHQAYGWAGYTAGHRAYLRCFPDQDAAVVLLANSAGPLFGPPGGSAVFDSLLPRLLELLEVPPLPAGEYAEEPTPVTELAGTFGPAVVEADGSDALRFQAEAFGMAQPVTYERLGGNSFNVLGSPPGSMPLSFDNGLLYLGPFALPRS